MKKLMSFVCLAAITLLAACNLGFNPESDVNAKTDRAVLTSSYGNVTVSGMSNNNLTVSFAAGRQYTYARLYLSEGNGAGLIVANADMNYSNGTYTYSVSHPTYVNGAKIYVGILCNNSGAEFLVPQGALANATSWSSVTYGDNSTGSAGSGSSDLVNGGIYKIVAKCSGKALDNDGWSTSPSTNIHQWEYGGNQANQQWILNQCSDGNWTVTNVHSGMCLDADGWGTADGTNILQWYNNQQNNQKFTISKLSDGSYRFINVHSGKALDVNGGSTENGANVQLWTWNNTYAQHWELTLLSTSGNTNNNNNNNNSGSSGNTGSGTNPSAGVNLIGLNNGYEMTFQFMNNTRGNYSNDRIYVCIVARDASGNFCYVTPNGQTIPIVANSTSNNWSYRLSDINGFQIPTTLTSGRLYISMDRPMAMRGIAAADGLIGVVQPNLANPSDENIDILFDWIEFTVQGGGFWGNTTQVDQFCFPVTMSMYNDGGYYRSVGITETRDQIRREFINETPGEFDILVSDKRIIAPCKGGFENGGRYGNYMASYVNEVWNYYASNTLYVNHPLGTFTGYTSGNQFIFYCTNGYGTAKTGERYYITNKPTNNELFEGSGVLASPSPYAGGDGQKITVELALQAQMCAALNRHVVTGNWTDVSSYYRAGPANYYAKFWHDHSIDGYAYGFCYDDVNDQSTLIETHSPRGLVIGIGW